MFQIRLTRQAEKAFDFLMSSQPQMGKRIAKALDVLGGNPDIGVPLRGTLKGCFKYRVGSYRIIYQINRSVLKVIIIDIGHRREVYRWS